MKNSHIKSLLILISMSQVLAAPYSMPEVRDISENNFNNTGFARAADHVEFTSKSDVSVGEKIMVYDRYQATYTIEDGKLVRGRSLGRLDRLTVVDNSDETPSGKILVKVNYSKDRYMTNKTVLVNLDGLSVYDDHKEFDADVFVVQNIATEKLRVYQRVCKDNSCPPKIILETDFVAGFKKGDDNFSYRTRVGSYRVFEWHKFYQDKNGGHYPSWYDPSFPSVPDQDESWSKWFKDDVMPWKSDGSMMRGAFGWYTALVEPNSNEQWTHGTIGWGESSEKNIRTAKGESFGGVLASFFTSLRSSGCSRVSNKAIAFLRHMLPIGTPILKVYALEKYQDEDSMKKTYDKDAKFTWDYALTTDGVRATNKGATSAHKNFVESRGLRSDEILEEGTFEFSNYPHVVQPRGGKSTQCDESDSDKLILSEADRKSKKDVLISDVRKIKDKECNLYKIPADAFKGVFYVDTGLFDGYDHPKAEGIIKGGFNSEFLPKYVEIKSYKK